MECLGLSHAGSLVGSSVSGRCYGLRLDRVDFLVVSLTTVVPAIIPLSSIGFLELCLIFGVGLCIRFHQMLCEASLMTTGLDANRSLGIISLALSFCFSNICVLFCH